MRRKRDEQLFDADITPGIRDSKVPLEDDHSLSVGAFADGGTAIPAHDMMDMESGVVGGGSDASVTGIGAGTLGGSRKKEDES